MYCILDIESTGGPFGKEAIMEIALFRYDGSEIVDQLISLVHPHREVQQYVSKITGITSKMLLRAPRFHE
ncbi:MAG: PolC-type DNA polymerase III, partial [Owenweeksia sp.]